MDEQQADELIKWTRVINHNIKKSVVPYLFGVVILLLLLLLTNLAIIVLLADLFHQR